MRARGWDVEGGWMWRRNATKTVDSRDTETTVYTLIHEDLTLVLMVRLAGKLWKQNEL